MESKRLPEVGETVTVTDTLGRSSQVDVLTSGDSAFEFMGADGLRHMRMAAWHGDKRVGWNFLPKAEDIKPMKKIPEVGDEIKFIRSGNIAKVVEINYTNDEWFSVSPMELHCEAIRVDWENVDCVLGWVFYEAKQPSLEERIDTLSGLVREMLDLAKSKGETHCAGCPEHPVPRQEKCRVCDHLDKTKYPNRRLCPDKNCYCIDSFHSYIK